MSSDLVNLKWKLSILGLNFDNSGCFWPIFGKIINFPKIWPTFFSAPKFKIRAVLSYLAKHWYPSTQLAGGEREQGGGNVKKKYLERIFLSLSI